MMKMHTSAKKVTDSAEHALTRTHEQRPLKLGELLDRDVNPDTDVKMN